MSIKKSKPEISKPLTKSHNHFPVVGIGASAGGLDAFKKLLKAIPENSGIAYVLVQHLDPSHESLLPELLQKVSCIPVLEVTDSIKVVPDHIYIIPTNKMLISNDGVLELSPRPAKSKNERNLPIDLFFASLAEVHQSHAIGVVLSGTGTDGTLGLKAIKDHGGITFAQNGESAQYDGMPLSAVHAGVVDFILSPDQMPQKLLEVIHIISGAAVNPPDQGLPQKAEDVYKQILSLLRIRKGVDFTYYKQNNIRRRILRRMALNKNEDLAVYLDYLRENKTEQNILFHDMLIPVTSFFRDPKVFDNLCESIFPAIIVNKIPGETIRIWVAGCSTGEEVYSMAICFKEFLGERTEKLQIFATDLSEPAILKARSGIYAKNETEGITAQRLQQFFTKTDGSYQVNKTIRDLCVFAVHNFLKDPPFGKVDFISCRNVLIHLEPYLQKKALATFHYALSAKGFLLLGKSETTGNVTELFASASKNAKLFTRKNVPGTFMQTASLRSEQGFANLNAHSKSENTRTDFQKTADDILLSKYSPAGVVINEAMDIVHFHGGTGAYLEPSPGKASLNLLKMAKEGLAFELRNVLHKSKKENKAVLKENIPVQVNGSHRFINIEAIPLPNIIEPHYLILFHDKQLSINSHQPLAQKSASAKSQKLTINNQQLLRIEQLEKELTQVREDMRSITEDQEAANEELQSTNEELLSSSEELQSLNEEMETSKEELQSTNEELTVVNQEMISLNEHIISARDYAEAIVTTIREPMLVLDRNLRVKTANNSFYKTFQVLELETEGRLIYDLGNRQWNIPALRTLLEEILPEKTKFTDFEVAFSFPNVGDRIMLLNGREIISKTSEEKLILLAIEDITERKQAGKLVIENEKRLRSMLLQSPFAIAIFKGQKMIIDLANDAIKEVWAKGPFVEGRALFDVLPELDTQLFSKLLRQVYETGKPYIGNALLQKLMRNGVLQDTYFNFSYHPYYEVDFTISGVICIAYEVTEEIVAQKKLEQSEHRYHNLIHTSVSMICILKGKDFIISIANDSILEAWGKGKEVIGQPLLSVLPEIIEQGLGDILKKVFNSGKPYYGYETPVYLNNNSKNEHSYFTFLYQAQKDLHGEIEGVAIIANEVTPQAIYNLKIKQSEERFQAAVNAVEGILWTNNAKGEMEGEQPGWALMTGQSYEEYQRFGWAQAIHPDDRVPTVDAWNEAVRESRNFVFEHRVKLKNGSYLPFSVRAIPLLNADGLVREWVGVHTDIHEQKDAIEEQKKITQYFHFIADAMPQKVWTADAMGNYNYVNKCWLDYTGLDFDNLKDWGWKKIVHPDDWEQTEIKWQQSINTGKNFEIEHQFLNTEGKYKWHLTRGLAQKDENGIIKMWIGTNTEMQHIKEEEQRKGDFLKMVSHELKTPVTSIKGYVQLLLSILEEHKAIPALPLKTSLNRIDSQLIRLTRLITEMLDLSRIELGRMELQKQMFNLDELIADTVQDVIHTSKSHAIRVQKNISYPVVADKDRIGQVLINLLNNALKYSPVNNAVEINIYPEENNMVAVSIKDFGIGINKEDREKIFDRFYRAGGQSEMSYAGFGIGLFIAKEIIQRHDGFIKVESEIDKGSTFTFLLPLPVTGKKSSRINKIEK